MTTGQRHAEFGVGSDWKITETLFAGAEVSWRDLDVPYVVNNAEDSRTTNWREQTHGVYLNWAPHPRWVFNARAAYDQFKAQRRDLRDELSDVPEEVRTFSVPLGVRYFDPSGFFAGVGVNFVHQEVDRSDIDVDLGRAQGDDSFTLFDAELGYRFPRRFGQLSLRATNIFDTNFKYQDDSYREQQDKPSVGPYFPDREIFLYLVLNW